eukprot:166217_1
MALRSQIDSHKIHEGYLYKKGVYNKSWRRRYFVLYDDRTMDYFKHESHSSQRNKAKGIIHLTQIKHVEFVEYDDPTATSTAAPAIAKYNMNKNNNTANTYDKFRPTADDQKTKPQNNANYGVNGWSTSNHSNVVISSIAPPDEYTLTETEKHFMAQREMLCKSLEDLRRKQLKQSTLNITNNHYYKPKSPRVSRGRSEPRAPQPTAIMQSMVSVPPPAICELTPDLTDDDAFPHRSRSVSVASSNVTMTSTASSRYMERQVISNDIQKHHHFRGDTQRDEYDAFQMIWNASKSNLKCDKMYAFALISRSNGRDWMLSAETNQDLKQWITVCSKLSQGDVLLSGSLNNKHFVLYQHKVLNCYKDVRLKHIEFDMDLRHILYLKYDKINTDCARMIEIGLHNETNNVVLNASSARDAYQWFQQIKSLFCDKLVLKIIYDSEVLNINISHSGQDLKRRHIAMYRDYIVIFRDKQQLHSIKTMTFFSKTIFRDYARKQKCILIPLNANMKMRAASKNNGKYVFLVSNADGDRKWYFSVKTKAILKKWLNLLSPLRYKHSNVNGHHHHHAKKDVSDILVHKD